MQHPPLHRTRRAVLKLGATVPFAALGATAGHANWSPQDDTFAYEVTRTDAEWRGMLNDQEFAILRLGATEPRQSSLNAFEDRPGSYHCKGCDLPVFDGATKVLHFDIGWAFFKLSYDNSLMTAIDDSFDMMGEEGAAIECHCRRCGSHLGHILNVRGQVLHCVNGSSLVFNMA